LFARLRSARRAAVAAGALTVDRQLATGTVRPAPGGDRTWSGSPNEPASGVGHAPPPPAAPAMSEQTRMDLMTMRVRLLDEPAAAGEIAEQLERVLAEGLQDPLALRVLGEAYLKLGRVEQAAAQFRQAMAARQRGRGER
jgi:hypothetical protein